MVAPTKPRKVLANGKTSYWLVPAVANKSAPTITEINAATGINLSCTLIKDFEGPSASTSKVTLTQYLCETESYEANDTTTYTIPDISGGFDPQAAAASADKKGYEFVRNGYTGFLIRRQGITADTASPDVTTGQFVDVIPVEIAKAVPGQSSNDSSGIFTFSAAVSVTGPAAWNVAAA